MLSMNEKRFDVYLFYIDANVIYFILNDGFGIFECRVKFLFPWMRYGKTYDEIQTVVFGSVILIQTGSIMMSSLPSDDSLWHTTFGPRYDYHVNFRVSSLTM